MPRLVVAHRLERGDIRPFRIGRRRTVFLQHFSHGFAQRAEFFRGGADHMRCHDRG